MQQVKERQLRVIKNQWLSDKKPGVSINKSGISPEYAAEGTYIGYWKLQFEGNKLTFCSRMRKILEIPRTSENVLHSVLQLLTPQQRRELIFEIRQSCSNGNNFEKNVKVLTRSGRCRWLKVSGMLYHRRWGRAEQMIGTIEDVTQKISEDCVSLGIVNHELRSPLTIIKLNVQMLINLMGDNLNKNPLKILKTVDLHIDTMTKIMQEYLCTSQNEHRESQLNFTVFDINDLIDSVIGEMRIIHTGYRFCKEPGAPVFVRADKYQIIQVLINYFTNAVNFSPPCSHVKIDVVVNDGVVEVAIQDQGIGIPVGQEKQIFQRYYRANQKAVRQINSKGLGLYVVEKIINEHNGYVKAERGINVGSIFYFSLPVFEEEAKLPTQYAVVSSGF